eukprot:6198237-Pleurochrysis_carterae.AAC.3
MGGSWRMLPVRIGLSGMARIRNGRVSATAAASASARRAVAASARTAAAAAAAVLSARARAHRPSGLPPALRRGAAAAASAPRARRARPRPWAPPSCDQPASAYRRPARERRSAPARARRPAARSALTDTRRWSQDVKKYTDCLCEISVAQMTNQDLFLANASYKYDARRGSVERRFKLSRREYSESTSPDLRQRHMAHVYAAHNAHV